MAKKTKAALDKDRQKRLAAYEKLMEDAKAGLHESQVEVVHAPWRATWERMDLMLERQERIIELLERMTDEGAAGKTTGKKTAGKKTGGKKTTGRNKGSGSKKGGSKKKK